MNILELALRQPWVASAGWALVHFLWQGAAIGILLAALRGAAGRRLTPRARYAAACLALAAMSLAPLATFLALDRADASQLPAPLWRVSPAAWDRILPWCVVAWLCGVALFSVRLIGGWRVTVRLRTAGVRPAPSEWQRSLEDLVRRMRVSAPVRLLVSSRAAVPMVVGWLRPVVLMPTAALLGLPPEQVQALLAHELAHILRRDYLVNVLQNIAEALLFYHPAVWWVSGQIRAERELCCDDLAVAASGDAFTYACALADLESARRARLRTALAADGGSLLARIRRLAGEAQPLHNLPGPATAWALGLLWLAGLGAAALHGTQSSAANAIPPPAPIARVASAPITAPPPQPAGTHAEALRPAPARRLASALLFDPLFAPPQASPPVPAQAVPPKKTRVEGTVLSLAGDPLKRAAVHLAAATWAPGQPIFAANTDDAGKFAIEGAPPGGYTLSVNKVGFLQGSYGARSATSQGTILTLTDGAQLRDLEIKLTPQGIITGRVTDADGEPIHGGVIHPHRVLYVDGHRRMMNAASQPINSLGRFTIGGLNPGRYYLSAETLDRSPDLEPGMADVQTLYPSALDLAGAVEIEVGPGARLDGIDIRLRRERVYTASGKVMFAGAPVATPVRIMVTRPGAWPFDGIQARDGSFAMRDLLPGEYVLTAMGSGPVVGRFSSPLTGTLKFTIADRNLDGLVLPLEQGAEVRGVLKLDGQDWQSQHHQTAAPATTLTASAPRPSLRLTSQQSPDALSAQAGDDGAFRFDPAGQGNYSLDVTGLPPNAYVRSVLQGPEDVTRSPVRIASSAAPLEIDISSHGASINGTLADEHGQPMSGVQVMAWPKVPNYGSVSHGTKSANTDQNGAFQLTALAPGEYYVAAWEDLDIDLQTFRSDPDFLARFNTQAAEVKLDEGDRGSVSVKMISKAAVEAEAAKIP
jgi:beta-lactamase regulating signal transducer with metallopeptidase domain